MAAATGVESVDVLERVICNDGKGGLKDLLAVAVVGMQHLLPVAPDVDPGLGDAEPPG